MASTGITPRSMIISQLVGGSIRLLTRNITWENNSNHNVLRMFFIDKSSSFKFCAAPLRRAAVLRVVKAVRELNGLLEIRPEANMYLMNVLRIPGQILLQQTFRRGSPGG